VEAFAAEPGGGWPAWAFSNHDVPRAVSRWGGPESPVAFAKLLITLLGCLRGTAFLYQGEELGLPEAEIPFERLQDPFGRALWPIYKGRDGCRTPMPWDSGQPYAGFSRTLPWLPIPESHGRRSIADQQADPDSVLVFTRHFLNWRRTDLVLRLGDLIFSDTAEPVLAFTRSLGDRHRFCAFNLGADPARVAVPPGFTGLADTGLNNIDPTRGHDPCTLLLNGYGAAILGRSDRSDRSDRERPGTTGTGVPTGPDS
jgi:alpha-glucosidase